MNDAPAAISTDAFAQRVSRWFAWTDAISLSAALNGPTQAAPAALGVSAAAQADERELARLRAALARTIAQATGTGVDPARPGRRAPAAAPPADFPSHRERFVACQQAMETGVAALRRRVRSTLSAASPALARLADVDAALEQVLGEREYASLAGVAGRLEQRFERLRRVHGDPPAGAACAWLDAFRREMRNVLLAELELRLQPVEGLLEALRAPQ